MPGRPVPKKRRRSGRGWNAPPFPHVEGQAGFVPPGAAAGGHAAKGGQCPAVPGALPPPGWPALLGRSARHGFFRRPLPRLPRGPAGRAGGPGTARRQGRLPPAFPGSLGRRGVRALPRRDRLPARIQPGQLQQDVRGSRDQLRARPRRRHGRPWRLEGQAGCGPGQRRRNSSAGR